LAVSIDDRTVFNECCGEASGALINDWLSSYGPLQALSQFENLLHRYILYNIIDKS
jgi:hypothetical protein